MNILYTVIIYPITLLIEFIFVFVQNFFKETGIAILCMSGTVSILCLPLYMVAEKWQETERAIQKQMASKISKIKSAFKGDQRYMILSAFYRQSRYHPVFAMRSTFGLLVQIPFFIAAYSYLSHLDALNGTSFFFINDLSKPDMLIPIAGGLNLLPILMTAINCTAGIIYTQGFAIKDKIPIYGIALIFLILLYNSPSALVLYWTLNNIFSLAKNGYLKLPFRRKHFLMFAIISLFAMLAAYYSLFVFHGNPGFRILVAVIFLALGILPWTFSFFTRVAEKLHVISWTPGEYIALFAITILIIWASTGVFLPSLLIGASPQEFSYIDNSKTPLYFIFNTALQAFGLFIFWPLAIFFLVSKKTKSVFAIFMAAISFCALCNIFAFSGNYGNISSYLVFDGTPSHNSREILLNIFVLLVLSAFTLFFYYRGFKKTLSFISITLFIAIASISVKMVYSINLEFKRLSSYYAPGQSTDETISPLLQLSKTGKNVLLIMLDMAESVFIPYIFEESPELNEKFDGFIYYPNTVTFNGYTKGGAPPVFGGYDYTPLGINKRNDITLKEKYNEALHLLPILFSQSGFSVIVTDPPYADGNWIPDLRIYDDLADVQAYITDGVFTERWLKQNNITLPTHSDVLRRNILWYAMFRELPLAFRQAVYFKGSWCASFSEARIRNFLNGYAVLDYLAELTAFEPLQNNTAIFMVNNTAHESLFLEAPIYKPQLSVTGYGSGRFNREVKYHANTAAIKRISEYFDFLKYQNVYDNTRIILVSDHGVLDNSYVTKTGLPFHVDHYNPVLLVKDFNAAGELKTDMAFMSTADVPAIAMMGLIENPVNPFTGNAITDDKKLDPLLILTGRVHDKNDYEIELGVHNTHYLKDNIFDEKNWTKPEKLP